MKRTLFSLLLLCFAIFGVARAQETLTVYDGEATSGYVPVYGFYADAYQKVEMIMPADDLSEMQSATISKLTWYLPTPAEAAWGGNFKIYLKEVTETTPTAYADLTGATLVFEGPLDGTGATLTIEFANSYTYQGGNLLIAVHQVEKGTYKSASFAGTEVTGAAIQGYSYNSLDDVNSNIRNFLPKTMFEFTPGSGTIYYKPKNLAVSNITTSSATVTWEAGNDETSWGVEYKKATVENWTSAGTVNNATITLNTLENGVMYDVRVKSIYSTGESGWAQTSFATLACEVSDMGEVAYTLTDTYGDGWNGNKLQIYLAGTDILIAELTIPTASGNSLLEGTVMLCYNVDYDLVWVSGSYAYETGFVLTGPEGETIYEFQGTGSSSGPSPNPGVLTTFQIHPNTCPRPTNVTASDVTYNSATITWTPGTAEQDLWEVIYAAGEVAAADITMIPIEVSEPMYTLTGLDENTTYSAYVRSVCSDTDQSIWSKVCNFATPLQFPIPTGLAISDITVNSAKATWTGEASTYNFRYRQLTGLNESFEDGGVPAGWTVNGWDVLHISQYTMGGTPLYAAEGGYCMASKSMDDTGTSLSSLNVDNWLISPKVDLGGTLEFYVGDLGSDYIENFGVYVSTTGNATTDFTAVADNIATPGVMISSVDAWAKQEIDLTAYEGQEGFIAIRHHDAAGYYLFVDAVKINGVTPAEWITLEGVTSPTVMENLAPLTTYEAQVQGIYADGVSAWTNLVYFTTLAADAMPTSVTVDNITAISADVVVVGSQETYNIRYRKAAVNNGIVEDFTGIENGGLPDGWTVIDNDGDGYNWAVWVLTLESGSQQITLSSNSYVNYVGALTPDNWVITPQRKLGAQVSFDAWGQDPSYAAEHFQVYVSTTGMEISDFTAISNEIITSGTQTTYTFDIPSTAVGKQGYIAIRHFNVTDQYILNVTNFYLQNDGDTPPGDWITVENTAVPYTIQGLDPETEYELQVQGILADLTTTDWTDILSFTTLQGFFKHIVGYGTSDEGYYFIASPVDNVDPATVPNLIGEHYDLYAFDESQEHEEWRNYKVNPSTFRLTSGVGYLYANKEDVDLVFSGTPATGTSFNVTLAKTANVMMEGWNLVGNPFGVEAYIDRAFYIMEGNGYVAKTANDAVEIMQGVLVSAESDGETMAFSTEKSTTKSANVALNLTRENSLVDRAIVSFGEGHNLGKLSFRESSSKIYMPVNGKDYAVVYAEEMGEMPVNFKAEHSGTYTIGVNTENVELGYLHLIDNMTGNDVDLLANPSYTFDAKATDYASRFKLVFATGNNEQFAFIGNGEIILNGINGNTTVQLFDVTGRMLSSTNGATRISTESMAAGVYMLRLVNGNDVKTQKIVVK